MKTLLLILTMFLIPLTWSCNKEQPADPVIHEAHSAQQLIKMHLSDPGTVSVAMVNAARDKMLSDLIKSDQDGQDKTANPGAQDTSNIQAVFQLTKMYETNNGYRVRHRLKIFSGGYQPDIYSFCYIVKNSTGLTPLNSSIKLEYQSNCIDFPPLGTALHTSVITHIGPQAFYFVFFDLQPFPLEWVDRIILEMTYYNPSHSGGWVTVDRSDPNNFALSPDGYHDYKTYFYPDTLHIN